MTNRMRNLNLHVRTEYDVESMKFFWCWERIEIKMADFPNHRRFSLRCLSEEVTPVSIRFKSNIKTPKVFQIIRRAEKALLNERIMSINNTINMLSLQKDTCKNDLKEAIGDETMEEYVMFIKTRKEARHFKTMNRQKRKIERLCHHNSSSRGGCSNTIQSDHTVKLSSDRGGHSNITQGNHTVKSDTQGQPNKWVTNISDKPLTKAQEKHLSHGHNFVVVPKNPPIMEYIATVEHVCTKLGEGKAEELRVEVKAAIKKIHKPQLNIIKEERIALAELKKDHSKMILTADKGVALMIMNTEDYEKKAEDLLNHHMYRSITSDPTMRLKSKLITLLKSIKAKGGMKEEVNKRLYPTGAGSPKFYGLPKIHKVGMPLRPIVSSIGTVTYETSKELARIFKPPVGKSPYHVQNS